MTNNRELSHPQTRLIAMDADAADLAESILKEWLDWFGDGMDMDDRRATERALSALSQLRPVQQRQ